MISPKISAIALCLSAQISFAGTLGDDEISKNYNGFYAGLGTGMTTLFTTHDSTFSRFTSADTFIPGAKKFHASNAAIIFDAQLGYGVMTAYHTYLGVKGSVYYTPIQSFTAYPLAYIAGSTVAVNGGSRNETELQPFYNIDGVLGYEIYPHILPFIEAGVNFSNAPSHESLSVQSLILPFAVMSRSSTLVVDGYKTGGNIGVGMNYQIHQHWILTSELVYHYLGQYTASHDGFATPVTIQKTNQLTTLLAGVSYLFN